MQIVLSEEIYIKLVKEEIEIWIKNDVGLRTELREHLLDYDRE